MPTTKICFTCNKYRELKHFGIKKSRSDGLTHECKRCRNEKAKQRYAEDTIYRDNKLKDNKRYRDEVMTPEQRSVYDAKWRAKPEVKVYNRIRQRKRRELVPLTPDQKKHKYQQSLVDYHTKPGYKMKAAVRAKLHRAIKNGKIEKLPCQYPNCKYPEKRVEAHHWDYSKPLEVTWLCTRHHALAEMVKKAKEQYPPNF
jgi:hypothetical protein